MGSVDPSSSGSAAGSLDHVVGSLNDVRNDIRLKGMKNDLYKASKQQGHAGTAEFRNTLQEVSQRMANGSTTFQEVPEENMAKTVLEKSISFYESTLLHIAARSGNAELAEFLLGKFPGFLTWANHKGDTALHVAAKVGHLNVVRILVRQDDIESNNMVLLTNKEGNTPLHEAILNDHEQVVKYLLDLDSTDAADLRKMASFVQNNEGKSPLYLAVEAGKVANVRSMMNYGIQRYGENGFHKYVIKGKSIIRAALMGRNLAMVKAIVEIERELLCVRDEEQQNPLHCAAAIGYLEGVVYLLNRSDITHQIFQKDEHGDCAIHLASKNNHLGTVQEFLRRYPDAIEILNGRDQNILHAAAENGRYVTVKYLLASPMADLLLNERDEHGNTALHLASRECHPRVVRALTWDKRVNLKIVNKDGLTALEVAEFVMKPMATFGQRLTWMELTSAGAARAKVLDTAALNRLKITKYEPYTLKYCKHRVNTILLVAALVATVTFAAGFSMPGVNEALRSHEYKENVLHNVNLQVFVVCDSIALYSSIFVVIILMWAQLGDLSLLLNSLRIGQKFLALSLAMMIVAFMAALHLVMVKLLVHWLGILVLFIGISTVVGFLAISLPFFLPYTSNNQISRYISYYPFYVLMVASESLG